MNASLPAKIALGLVLGVFVVVLIAHLAKRKAVEPRAYDDGLPIFEAWNMPRGLINVQGQVIEVSEINPAEGVVA